MTNEYCTPKDISDWMVLKKDEPQEITVNADAVQADINMGANIIHYDAGDVIRLVDGDTPIGEYLTILSIAGTVITCTTNLVNSYTTAKVATVQNQTRFTNESEPNKTTIESMIDMNQAIIDRDLHTSFLSTGLKTEEEITYLLKGGREFPYFSMPLRYGFSLENALVLQRMPILPLNRAEGDQLWLQWGADWFDALDPKNGKLLWDGLIETTVDAHSLATATPITAVIETGNLRMSVYPHWKLTHANITAFTLEIIGLKMDGTSDTETFTEADGWEGWTLNAYQFLTSVKLTARTGAGTGDTLTLDTQPQKSRMGSNWHLWANYRLGHIYHKGDVIDSGFWTTKAAYRFGFYGREGNTIPRDVKKACILRCAIDILGNERYAMNLVSSGDLSNEKVSSQISRWQREYDLTIAKRRQTITYRRYE